MKGSSEEYIKSINNLSDKELLFDHALCHAFWNHLPKGMKDKGWTKEKIFDIHTKIEDELRKRGYSIDSPLKRTADVRSFRKHSIGPPISVQDVLVHYKKPIILKKGIVKLTGGLAIHGETVGDIDILIHLPPDTPEWLKKPIEFRLGRALPEKLASRVSFLYGDLYGPFTSYFDVYDLVLVPAEQIRIEMSRLRDEEAERQAKISRAEDEIKPLRFFYPLKATRGYHEGEVYKLDQILLHFEETDYPLYIEKKYDGARLIWMKSGDKVIVRTDDGYEVTDRLPTLVEKFKKIPFDLVIDTEVEGWKGREHIGREKISGYLHKKKEAPDDSWLVPNVFDILWLSGFPKHHEVDVDGDLHNLPYEDRRRILKYVASYLGWQSTDRIPKTGEFNLVPSYILEEPDEKTLKDILERVKNLPGSEGAVIKDAKGTYPLTGLTKHWLKYKKSADVHAVVIDRKKVKGSEKTWNYYVGLLIPSGWKIPEKYIRKVELKNGKKVKVCEIGKTFNTNIQAKPGDIITVQFHTAFLYEREGKRWMRIYEPKVYELRPDQILPDTLDDFLEIAEQAGILQIKHRAETELMDDKPHNFIFQHHYRGRSVHTDFRIKFGKELIGWTLDDQIEGSIPEPVTTLEQAKELDDKVSKLSNKPASYKENRKKILVEKKLPEPDEWFDLEGVVPKGEVGATKNYPGVFSIYERGKLYFGAVKPYFVEMFLNGKKFTGRWVIRQLPNPFSSHPKFVYLFWKPQDQMPYVLTKRAVEKEWMPPEGISALPPEIRKQIPKEYRYWKHKGTKAREIRDELVEKIKKGEIKITIPKKWKGGKTKGVLQYVFWRGQIVVRKGPSHQLWILWIGDQAYGIDRDPLKEGGGVATELSIDKRWRDRHNEDVPPGTDLNPTKATPAYIMKVVEDSLNLYQDDPMIKKFEWLDRCWLLEKEDPNGTTWILKEVECAPQ